MADRVARDLEEEHRKGERDGVEAVIELGMIERRWLVLGDPRLIEEAGDDDDESPETGPEEDALGEIHARDCLHLRGKVKSLKRRAHGEDPGERGETLVAIE